MTASASPAPAPGGPVSPTPRRLRPPSWLNVRTIVGVLLVIGSVALGAKVVASSDDRVGVWQATRDLAPGTVLTEADARIARVRLPSTEQYIPADRPIAGTALSRQVDDGELLPRSSIGDAEPGVSVTIPVAVGDAPSVRRGQRITVWVSAGSCRALAVLSDVVAQDVVMPRSGALGGSSKLGVTVRLSTDLADRVVAALALPEAVIRVGVLSGPPSGSPPPPPPPPPGDGPNADLDACGAK